MQTTVPIDADSWLVLESPEFSVRFGRLLTTTRRRSKCSIEALASSSLVGFDASQLRQFEQGATAIDESIVEALCLLYSADIGRILPVRLPVAIGDGRLSGAGVSVDFSPDDPTSLLIAYLRLIRRMRNQKKAPAIALRREDILTLARYLDVDGADVVERLSTLMNVTAAQRNTMSMLFATGAIVIALAAGGHASAEAVTNLTDAADTSGENELVRTEPQVDLVLDSALVVITDDARAELAPPVTAPARLASASTEPAAIVERAPFAGIDGVADPVGLSTAKRMQVPVATPPLTVAAESPTPTRSGCNPDPSEAVMSVVIPDIAYTCPVYAGGQSTIDAGFVTLVTDAGVNPVLATRPGAPGTLWLAGHRTTHGAAFAQVPDLADGALVTVSSGDVIATYRVVGRSYVEVRGGKVIDTSGQPTAQATWASIIRNDFGGNLAPRLVLQTCDGENFRWMIYADLVTG